MARLYKRGVIWWAWGYDANRRRWARSTRCTDRRAAETVARDLERRLTAVDGAPKEALSVEQAILDVIASRETAGRSPYTVRLARSNGGHLCRVLGARREVHELTAADLEGYVARRLAEGAKRSTAAIELGTLRGALLHARLHKRYGGDIRAIWPTEVLARAHVPKERYLTRSEYALLFAALPAPRRDYLASYVATGCRKSELWILLPSDVDLDANMLHIRGTKTVTSDRYVPIAPELRAILVRRMATTVGPLFPKWSLQRVLWNACARAGIPDVSPNDLRRTFASWLAQAGVPILLCAKLMGHVGTKQLERVYARFGSDDAKAAIARLGAVAPVSQTLAALPAQTGPIARRRKGDSPGKRGNDA